MADKSLSDLADSTVREQKQAVLTTTPEDRKERFRKRVEAEVRHQLKGWQDRMAGFQLRIRLLREDVESVNPRFAPIQLHTKTKWQTELTDILAELDTFLFEIAEPKLHWED